MLGLKWKVMRHACTQIKAEKREGKASVSDYWKPTTMLQLVAEITLRFVKIMILPILIPK